MFFDTRWQTLKAKKGGSPTSKAWGFFFGGSGHGLESSCQISAYYKFFPGLHVFCRISTGLVFGYWHLWLIAKGVIA